MNSIFALPQAIQKADIFQRHYNSFKNMSETNPTNILNYKLREKCNKEIDKIKLKTFVYLLIPFLLIIIGISISQPTILIIGIVSLVPMWLYGSYKINISITKKIINLNSTPDPITPEKCIYAIND